MIKTILSLFIITATIMTVRAQENKTIQRLNGISSFYVPNDTFPKSKYQKFRKVNMNDYQINRVAYVFDSIMGNYGIEMTGTQIRAAQKMFTEHLKFFLENMPMDSIKTIEPKNK